MSEVGELAVERRRLRAVFVLQARAAEPDLGLESRQPPIPSRAGATSLTPAIA